MTMEASQKENACTQNEYSLPSEYRSQPWGS